MYLEKRSLDSRAPRKVGDELRKIPITIISRQPDIYSLFFTLQVKRGTLFGYPFLLITLSIRY